MKRFFQRMSGFLKYGAVFVAGGFYIWAIIILLNDDNWIGISALTTMFLAIAAFWTIRQNYSFRRREQRQRLLNEIIEWAIEIQTNSLIVDIPFVKDVPRGAIAAHMEAASLFKYGATFTKNEYIRAIVKKTFEKELGNEVGEAIRVFTIFLYLKGKAFGMKNIEEAFKGTASTLIEEIRKQTKDDPAIINKLLKKHEMEIAKSINQLLVKVGETAANLV